jgi:hypothetical protein
MHTTRNCHCAAGEELTVSYLGREEFAPAGARQAVLQERYGFDCSCARCKLEAQAPKALQQQLLDTYRQVMQVSIGRLRCCTSAACVVLGLSGSCCSRHAQAGHAADPEEASCDVHVRHWCVAASS